MGTIRLLRLVDVENNVGIKEVTPQEFSARIIKLWLYLKQFVDAIIVPLALFGMAISVLVFVISSFVKSENGKKYGLAGLLSSMGAIFLYFTLPLVAGIISNAAKIINGS